jgi:hypothetical protein
MSNKTIAKFCRFVILIAVCGLLASSCSQVSSNRRYEVNSAHFSLDYDKPVAVGRIESNEIIESSGIAPSLCQADVLWTHNDSGDDEFIFAINSKGKHLGTWRVAGSRNLDWEDMAAFKDPSGTCFLYIGDIGNNKRERADLKVYRVKEPVITDAGPSSTKKNPLQTEAAEAAVFQYPDTPHNAETLMVQPQTGEIYVLTKRVDGPSIVYKIKPQFGASTKAEKVGEVALPAVPNGLLTGGAISPDGRHVIVCDYSTGYELKLGNSANFDEIWKSTPVPVDLGDRKQGEAVTFGPDGKSIFATSEKKNSPLIEARRKLGV